MTGPGPTESLHGAEILNPPLPYDMEPRVHRALGDVTLQQFVSRATEAKLDGRVDACRSAFGEAYDDLRRDAGAVRQHVIDHLDHYLEQWIDAATTAGTTVHIAADAAEARSICLRLADRAKARRCVKSKSMVTEEIELLPALEAAGVETIETDLGEFIVQLDDDAPSHIVTPMIHKDRSAVGRAFERELGVPYVEDPETLTAIARGHMRALYRSADLSITGANFLVAETGSLVICTNEGNADLCLAGPRVHVAVVGIEKVVPSLRELPILLKLLARSATAQALTVYTSVVTGPRSADAADGPDETHVVLVDNGRSRVLAAESRDLLRCIRCGACLNACPVYRKAGGGHAYGAVYSGPIGAALTPALRGLSNYPDLPQASSLCGACHHACPVDIDLPRHFVRLREEAVRQRLDGVGVRLAYRLWTAILRRPALYRVAQRLQRRLLRRGAEDTGGDRWSNRRWLRRGPGPLRRWTDHRDFPSPTSGSFREWWRERGGSDA